MKKVDKIREQMSLMENEDFLMTDSEKRQVYEELESDIKRQERIEDIDNEIIGSNIKTTKKGNLWFEYNGHRYCLAMKPTTSKVAENAYRITWIFRDGERWEFNKKDMILRSAMLKACSAYLEANPPMTTQTIESV